MPTTITPLSQLPLSDDFMSGPAAARGVPAFPGMPAGEGDRPY